MALPNFPYKPTTGMNSNSFPADLVSGQRQFYTQIAFVNYSSGLATGGGAGLAMGGSVMLPIPRKLNDNEVILWEEWSGKDAMLGLARQLGGINRIASSIVAGAETAGPAVSIASGQQINPFQFMMFNRPGFKEHTLQWTLAPNTQQESDTIRKIVNQCKKAALPTPNGKLLMTYPQIAQVSFKPNTYLYKLKPCAIISVQVDYTGTGGPSFFKSGAPTVVNLTLQLKEIQLWNTQNYEQ